MDLLLWFFLLMSSYGSCSSTVIFTPDSEFSDNNIFIELLNASPTEQSMEQFSHDRKSDICRQIIGSYPFKEDSWEYVEKPGAYNSFLKQCPACIPDHYSQDDITQCFVVKNQQIRFHYQILRTMSSFGCIAKDTTTLDNYQEVFVSYANVKDTFFISLRDNESIRNEETKLIYIGIVEIVPIPIQYNFIKSVESFFTNDYRQPGDVLHRLNRLSISRRHRICKIALKAIMNEIIDTNMVESWTIIKGVTVELSDEVVFIDAALQCLVYPRAIYSRYLALSEINHNAVYILKQKDNPTLAPIAFELTEYYVRDISALNEGYVL